MVYLQCILVSAAAAYVSLIKPPRSDHPTPSTLPVSCALSRSLVLSVLLILFIRSLFLSHCLLLACAVFLTLYSSLTLSSFLSLSLHCCRSLSHSLSPSIYRSLPSLLLVLSLFSSSLTPLFLSLSVFLCLSPFLSSFRFLPLFLSFLLSRPLSLLPSRHFCHLLSLPIFLLFFFVSLSRVSIEKTAATRRLHSPFNQHVQETRSPRPPPPFRRLLSIGR